MLVTFVKLWLSSLSFAVTFTLGNVAGWPFWSVRWFVCLVVAIVSSIVLESIVGRE